MITVATNSEELVRRMRDDAARRANELAERNARTRKTALNPWRSARTLWPDIGWE